jgi:hypothetical protein
VEHLCCGNVEWCEYKTKNNAKPKDAKNLRQNQDEQNQKGNLPVRIDRLVDVVNIIKPTDQS